MARLLKVFGIGFLVLFLLSSNAFAQSTEEMASKFYNDVAGIIENNRNDPQRCVQEIDRYCQNNRATLEKIRQVTERGMEQASQGTASTMSTEEAGEILSKSSLTETMNRFTNIFNSFAADYPEQADSIGKIIEQFAPRNNPP